MGHIADPPPRWAFRQAAAGVAGGPERERERAAAGRLSGGWPAHRPREGGRRWRLFLSPDGSDARLAAGDAIRERAAGAAFPPSLEELPLLLHELGPVPEAAGIVVLPDFHRAFPTRAAVRRPGRRPEIPPVPVIATPAYLLARLIRLGGGTRDLVASAREDALLGRAADLFAGRGAACSLEVLREPVPPPAARTEPSGPGRASLDAAKTSRDAGALRSIALRAPDLAVRAAASEAALEADPEGALAHLLSGCSLVERARPKEARAAFERARELDPQLAAAHFELGKTMVVLDDLDAALRSFRQATEALPEFAFGWANAGASLGELERPAEALPFLRKAAAIDPLSHQLASNLGVTLRDLGRLPEAEAAFRRALGLAPDFVFGHYNLANAVYLQGRAREAVGLFEKAREMDPGKSSRQGLLLAAARLAAGDEAGSIAAYREVFDSLEGRMRTDMRTVAQWDLRRLAERSGGISPALRRAALYLRSIRA